MQAQAQSHKDHSTAEENRSVDQSERLYWQLPMKVLMELGIWGGMVMADVGAGDGYFTIPIAKKVGKEGTVYDRDRYSMKTILKMIYSSGLEVVDIMDFLPVQNIYICTPALSFERLQEIATRPIN
jgi:predicted methyltransferase